MNDQGSAAQAVITEDVEIVGTIKSGNGLQINGKLNGDLNCSSDVVVGQTANIKGNMSVNSATIHGQISGNVIAKDRIELKSSARINGDVKAKRLTVEDGVSFVGKAEVNPSGVAGNRAGSSDAQPRDKAEEEGVVEESEEPSDDGKGRGKGFLGGKR